MSAPEKLCGKCDAPMERKPMNQCDGCRRGLPLVGGIHRGNGYDLIGCTADRYEPAHVATTDPAFWPEIVE